MEDVSGYYMQVTVVTIKCTDILKFFSFNLFILYMYSVFC